MIHASQEFQVAVVIPAYAVARAVKPLTLHEGIVDEPLRGQAGAVQVAARQTRAAEVELACHPDRRKSTHAIEHVTNRVRDRPSDRDQLRLLVYGGHVEEGGERGVLGRPVDVQQLSWRVVLQDRSHSGWIGGFAPEQETAQRSEDPRCRRGKLVEQCRREEHHRDPSLTNLLVEARR